MKADATVRIYKGMGYTPNHKNINKTVKAVVINFGDERGDIIVTNDNFGTRRKYADFTEGKRKAGLHPAQIVFVSLEMAHICRDKYVNADDEVCEF